VLALCRHTASIPSRSRRPSAQTAAPFHASGRCGGHAPHQRRTPPFARSKRTLPSSGVGRSLRTTCERVVRAGDGRLQSLDEAGTSLSAARTPPGRPRRAWRQRGARARCFTNAGVVWLGTPGVTAPPTASVSDTGAGAPTLPSPGIPSRLRRGARPEDPPRRAPRNSNPVRVLDRAHVRERAFSDVIEARNRAEAVL
jgi:hypothetical protein